MRFFPHLVKKKQYVFPPIAKQVTIAKAPVFSNGYGYTSAQTIISPTTRYFTVAVKGLVQSAIISTYAYFIHIRIGRINLYVDLNACTNAEITDSSGKYYWIESCGRTGYLTITFIRRGTQIELWLDDNLVGSKTISDLDLWVPGTDVFVGTSFNAADPGTIMTHVYVYPDYALTPDEVKQLVKGYVPKPNNLTLRLEPDSLECSEYTGGIYLCTKWYDKSGKGNHVDLENVFAVPMAVE